MFLESTQIVQDKHKHFPITCTSSNNVKTFWQMFHVGRLTISVNEGDLTKVHLRRVLATIIHKNTMIYNYKDLHVRKERTTAVVPKTSFQMLFTFLKQISDLVDSNDFSNILQQPISQRFILFRIQNISFVFLLFMLS